MKFKIGDIVRLKHSTVKMTVLNTENKRIEAVWYSTERYLQMAYFPQEALVNAENE